jgi:hypothetical protein
VSCSAGGASPVDPRDPTTVCEKNNGDQSAATVVTRYYKLCSVVPSNALGGVVVTIGAETLAEANHPDTEYTRVGFTAPSESILNLLRFTANFYPQGTTCP